MDTLMAFTVFSCFSVAAALGQRPPYYPASLGQRKQETGTGISLHTLVKMVTEGSAYRGRSWIVADAPLVYLEAFWRKEQVCFH